MAETDFRKVGEHPLMQVFVRSIGQRIELDAGGRTLLLTPEQAVTVAGRLLRATENAFEARATSAALRFDERGLPGGR